MHVILYIYQHNMSATISRREKTKKKPVAITSGEKARMWEILDSETNPLSIECCYSTDPDLCDVCSTVTVITEDGFPTCTNPSCAKINKKVVDRSAEWRYFGADDKNTNDPRDQKSKQETI